MKKTTMRTTRVAIGMPDLYIYVRTLAIGWFGAEIFRIAYLLGGAAKPGLMGVITPCEVIGLIVIVATLIWRYVQMRGGWEDAVRIGRSQRWDMLFLLFAGIWSNEVTSLQLQKLHALVANANPAWPPLAFVVLLLLIVAPLVRELQSRIAIPPVNLRFLRDDDIDASEDDLLGNLPDAKAFAETILESQGDSSLVFGVDGPWGIGKSSFINLVEQHLSEKDAESVIVFRFEPLRYAAESDLPAKFIRDLSAAIAKIQFAPEFPLAVSRYSRMLKGTADISFLGFKISLTPTNETVDDALENIDDVLKRLGKRLIVVIDDLDRLDAAAVNNVLFAIRRTYNLSQATYLLCYDTEVLAQQGEDARRTRHFLEKFITIKLSLFVDTKSLSSFLRGAWKSNPSKLLSIPSVTMLKLASVCTALADMLDGKLAANYQPLAGDLRKIKRFVNAALMMRMENFDIDGTDFFASDLVNLILLHLHYPGLFREIYAEETGGRAGRFSVRLQRDGSNRQWQNADEFKAILNRCPDESAKFLICQLFEVATIGLDSRWSFRDEQFYRGRACFNEPSTRTLEKYLELIVRFNAPDRKDSIRFYQSAIDEVIAGTPISKILERSEFNLKDGYDAHQQFWRVLNAQASKFTQAVADESIDSLIAVLPRYAALRWDLGGPRTSAVYALCQLLDSAGWGRSLRRPINSTENLAELAERILGEGRYKGRGIITQLAASARGSLGWHDVMIFRMTCSPDRGGQLYNISNALIKREDINGKTDGSVADIARLGMRGISQAVFQLFSERYISHELNFFDELDKMSDEEILGDGPDSDARQLAATRQRIKSYVIYQLANAYDATGSGVGCGFYDKSGYEDKHGISHAMNRYLFDICFNISRSERNGYHFADYCLRNFDNGFFGGDDDDRFKATEGSLISGVDKLALIEFWLKSGDSIKAMKLTEQDRLVVTENYVANYRTDLSKSFEVLDRMTEAAVGIQKFN